MDLPNVLSYLEAKGKTLYSPTFKIQPDDHEIIYQLLLYFTKDPLAVSKYNHAPHKGIMLSGPVGCGKSAVAELLRARGVLGTEDVRCEAPWTSSTCPT